MHIQKLHKLADFLEALSPKLFDYGQWMRIAANDPNKAFEVGGGCGTAGCAVGWMPHVFPDELRWHPVDRSRAFDDKVCVNDEWVPVHNTFVELVKPIRPGMSMENHGTYAAAHVLGITDHESDCLFSPSHSSPWGEAPSRDASPAEVADHIRKFIAYRATHGPYHGEEPDDDSADDEDEEE